MTAPLSQDLRQRIVHALDAGSSIRKAAKRFEVSASAAIKLMQRVRQTGSTEPAKIGRSRGWSIKRYKRRNCRPMKTVHHSTKR